MLRGGARLPRDGPWLLTDEAKVLYGDSMLVGGPPLEEELAEYCLMCMGVVTAGWASSADK